MTDSIHDQPTFTNTERYIERTYTDSSVMTGLKYDTVLSELTVHFKSGKSYLYMGVPENLVNELDMAPSHGQFLNQNIARTFKYRQL